MKKTTPRDYRPRQSRETTDNSKMASTPTPQGKWAKGPPTAVTPTEKSRIQNPYLISKRFKPTRERIMQPGRFIKILCDYMTIIESHNGTKNVVWHKWLKSGLNTDTITVHPLAKIVQYPKTKDKTLLNIGIHMLQKLPELERLCKLSTASRHYEKI